MDGFEYLVYQVQWRDAYGVMGLRISFVMVEKKGNGHGNGELRAWHSGIYISEASNIQTGNSMVWHCMDRA
jgi:hypothetical protein